MFILSLFSRNSLKSFNLDYGPDYYKNIAKNFEFDDYEYLKKYTIINKTIMINLANHLRSFQSNVKFSENMKWMKNFVIYFSIDRR